jgi:hypothetical protein
MLKLLGLAFLVLAGLAVALGGVGAPLGALLYRLHPPFLNTLQAGVQRNLSPALWDQAILPVLEWPAWALPLGLGLLLLLLGRRRG